MSAPQAETLLETDNKMLVLNLEREGKFTVKSTAWEDHKALLAGDRLEVEVRYGRWVIRKHPAKPPEPESLRPWDL